MARQTISVLSGTVLAKRISRSFRSRLALTTILAAAPFLGYGRQAFAACDPSPSPTFICSGVSPAQAINVDDADVSTVPGFSIPAGVGNAISIRGDGHLQFTDENASTINGTGHGLYIYTTGDSSANDGAITINANSNITGGTNAISAYNHGAGSVEIIFDGTATGNTNDGMEIFNSSNGEDVTITTGAQSTVSGAVDGIAAANEGSGDLEITANGNVYGDTHDGIYAYNAGGNLTITTGEDSYVGAFHVGIGAANHGDGDLTVTANGTVRAYDDTGIFVYNASGAGDLNVTTGAQSDIRAGYHGIDALNQGDGDLTIETNGKVYGHGGNGIIASNSSASGDLTITTGADSIVYGNVNGIYARNYSSGDLEVTANGQVTGWNVNGIDAVNSSNGYNLTIETGANSNVYGYQDGIVARNYGSGDLQITANGIVTGRNGDGIYAYNSSNGANVSITTGASSNVYGNQDGIDGRNFGYGDLTITANGTVTGQDGRGIYAFNYSNGYDLTVTTGAQSAVTGHDDGIQARNYGYGDLTITANGAVTGQTGDGIYANNYSNGYDLKITTGTQSAVTGFIDGIDGRNFGYGDLTITANGTVTGQDGRGLYAFNSSNGYGLTVTTGAQSAVTGHDDGIQARNYGYGDLTITANGAVTGQTGVGIYAYNSSYGYYLKITTQSAVTGNIDGIDARNFGSGTLEITANGEVTGTNARGIYVVNGGGGDSIIKVGASGLVQGDDAGVDAYSLGGQNIAITNDGVVRNLSGESDDLAILTRGGATTIDNNNTLTGTVTLSEFNDTLNNAGLWNMAGGSSDFGAGLADEVNNSGTLRAADDATTLEVSDIFNIENFNNSGLVTLVDGQAGDSLTIGKAANYTGNNGKLAVDAFLAGAPDGLSDTLVISDTALGTTSVVVNLTNPVGSTPNFIGIPVITVIALTTEDNFNLEGGVLNAGFFAWDLRLDGTTHELITVGLGAGSFEFAAGITGAQDIWYQTTGTLLQRQADLRAMLTGTQVTPVADFAEPVAPTPVANITPGFWFKGVGAWLDRDDDEDGFTLDREQTIFGGLAGFDFGTESEGSVWMFGLFGGYLTSDLKFDETNTEWTYEGPSVGVYATYLNDAFYADVTVKADFLDIEIDPDDLAPGADDADTDAVNIGGRIDTGYKFGHEFFVEPQASLAVVHTEIDDVDIFGGTVEFDDETSVRGRLGLRLGFEHTASDAIVYSGDVIASAWQEFNGNNNATIFAPDFPVTGVADDPGETFGDVSVGFSMMAPDGWSGFLRGNYQFGEDFEAITGNAGVRYAF